MVEDMLAYKGIIVTHMTVREWAEKFGWQYSNFGPSPYIPPWRHMAS
ncbi:transposase domain protein (plasmid) [Ochrobactrum quorumnocens]|uniref:Transposase domain protein n=1 Tax=Ochrobactrum quorumnocens TaxID=271865 RepID=A0A248UMY6_9HYPH|nr:transposase domain protein [[Ochrobactrum] quorumnocens]